MQGKIVKGISGFYYVHVAGAGIYECKAKGAFRNQKVKPLVGDMVELEELDHDKLLGNVTEILPRQNSLIRPAVANIDMALVIFAAAKPTPNLNLLDRFLCMMEYQHVPVTICFNKCDLVSEEERQKLRDIYAATGYPILFVSAKTGENLGELRASLEGKTTTVAGPSGVGKSSLVNTMQENVRMETGVISEKIERGKHTTRHSQIVPIADYTYIMDTPGFSSMDAPGLEVGDLWRCFPEFVEHEPFCKFQGCSHVGERDCGIKEALSRGEISQSRYDNYVLIYHEMKNIRKY